MPVGSEVPTSHLVASSASLGLEERLDRAFLFVWNTWEIVGSRKMNDTSKAEAE